MWLVHEASSDGDATAGAVLSPEGVGARDGRPGARHLERVSSVTGGEEGAPDLCGALGRRLPDLRGVGRDR